MSRPNVCVLATHHAYQFKTGRTGYAKLVELILKARGIDFVGEEAEDEDPSQDPAMSKFYARRIADRLGIKWENIDLDQEERKHIPDSNPFGDGALIDFEFNSLREWIWVIRTAKASKHAALVICGLSHLTGLAWKCHLVGFDVDTQLYFDRKDDDLIQNRQE